MTDSSDQVQIEAVDFRASKKRSSGGGASGRWRAILAGLVGVVLVAAAGLAWWVFTGPTLRVTVTPAADVLEVSGGLYQFAIGDEWLIGPGTVEISASKEGFQSAQQTVEIKRDDVEVSLDLVERPGLLSIRVHSVTGDPVERPQISLDGVALGGAPIDAHPVPGGKHVLVGMADRFQAATTNLVVKGRGMKQEVVLSLVPDWAELQVDADPDSAVVEVDGVSLGPVPVTRQLEPGVAELVVSAPGYKSFRTQLVVQAHVPLDLSKLVLSRGDGVLTVTSTPVGALVTVDGRFQGKTPVTVSVASGVDHQISVSSAGHLPQEQTVQLQPLQTNALAFALDPVLAEVRFEVEPAGTELIVDGTPVGPTPNTAEWTTVEHAVVIQKEGYESHQTTVTPRVGFPQVVRVKLKPVAVATPSPETPPAAVTPGATAETAKETKPAPMVMVKLKPGNIRMGSSRREQGRRSNETIREVVITRPYWISAREVSNAEFRRFRPQHHSGSVRQFSLNLEDQPVANVTWQDAAAYCNWLSEQEGLFPVYQLEGKRLVGELPLANGYRLPTEAEWAYAARGRPDGDPMRYSWGDSFPPENGVENLADQSIKEARVTALIPGYDDGAIVSAPVGSFRPTPNGLYDIGGNVAEWVHDHYTIHPYMPGTSVRDPVGPKTGRFYTIRGGSWRSSGISDCRLSFRDYGNEERDDVGFRVCRFAAN